MKQRIVIWGLRKRYHTHRHIHQAFYKNAKKLGYPVIWVEDEKENQKYIQAGDVIISAEVRGKMVPKKNSLADYNLPIRNDVQYCLHNFQKIFTDEIKNGNYINLAVYKNPAENADIKIDTARYFDTKTKTLYQPWGTDLLVSEFKRPVFNTNKFVIWVGSVWNDAANAGNVTQIQELKQALTRYGLRFIHIRFIPDLLNIILIRFSRIAPAIAGKYQVDTNYLPCRVFKNISYGQLGITNVAKFRDILGESYIESSGIEDLVGKTVQIDKENYINLVLKQQKAIENYTYKESLENIIKYLSL